MVWYCTVLGANLTKGVLLWYTYIHTYMRTRWNPSEIGKRFVVRNSVTLARAENREMLCVSLFFLSN